MVLRAFFITDFFFRRFASTGIGDATQNNNQNQIDNLRLPEFEPAEYLLFFLRFFASRKAAFPILDTIFEMKSVPLEQLSFFERFSKTYGSAT